MGRLNLFAGARPQFLFCLGPTMVLKRLCLRDVIQGLVNVFFQVSRDVEKEKMGAIISRNKLKSMTKAREQEQQQLQVQKA